VKNTRHYFICLELGAPSHSLFIEAGKLYDSILLEYSFPPYLPSHKSLDLDIYVHYEISFLFFRQNNSIFSNLRKIRINISNALMMISFYLSYSIK
jgi:hypothetical protein